MTTQYKVKTIHTKQMLLDFIKFSYRINHPKSKYRLFIMSLGLILIGFVAIGHSIPITIGGIGIGTLLLIMTLLRNQIAFVRLSAGDELYQTKRPIEIIFGQAEFIIDEGVPDNLSHIKYGEINQAYKDKRNYYLLINNQDLQVIPYESFIQGESDRFESFVSQKVGKPIYNMSVPLQERIRLMNEARKQSEQLHDKKVEEKRKESKNKKNK
ncbi:MAG: YcxB family protein [Suipraeoptans sp.]